MKKINSLFVSKNINFYQLLLLVLPYFLIKGSFRFLEFHGAKAFVDISLSDIPNKISNPLSLFLCLFIYIVLALVFTYTWVSNKEGSKLDKFGLLTINAVTLIISLLVFLTPTKLAIKYLQWQQLGGNSVYYYKVSEKNLKKDFITKNIQNKIKINEEIFFGLKTAYIDKNSNHYFVFKDTAQEDIVLSFKSFSSMKFLEGEYKGKLFYWLD